ncbi:MAG: hypothetical protein U5K38_16135 [Woeseiaceae bacterium]|nr:hypothetical protein [Woeseiaceae bacterium]
MDSGPEQAAMGASLVESDAVTKAFEPDSAELASVGIDDDETAVAGSLTQSESQAEAETGGRGRR